MMQPPDPHGRIEPRSVIHLPLLLGMRPDLQEFLKSSFGNSLGIDPPEWHRRNQGDVVEGFSMPREKFIEMAKMFLPFAPKN